jgi:hypothetical protein
VLDEAGGSGKGKKNDGKIKATPPLGRFTLVGQWVSPVPPETQWCRFSGKTHGINANCATHCGFCGF